jgi:competence protein ComEC
MDQAIAQAIGQSIGKNNSIMGIIGVPLQSGGFYLSAGDANAKDELRIKNWILSLNLSEYSPKILKVSHHGSATSTSSEWIRLTQPDEAWISAGNGNRYGHPSPKVVQLLREKGVKIKRTDTHGILVFE